MSSIVRRTLSLVYTPVHYSLGIAPASVEIVTKTLEKSDIDNKFVRTRTKKQKGGRTKRAGAQVK